MMVVAPHRLLFVCTANICRSPMAEALAGLAAERRGWRVEARSCGVEAREGLPAAPNSVKVVREVGGDLTAHRSQPMSEELVAWADRILCMELRHTQAARAMFPLAEGKLQLLGTFGGTVEIDDPYGSWIFTYRRTRDLLMNCIEGLYDTLPPRPR